MISKIQCFDCLGRFCEISIQAKELWMRKSFESLATFVKLRREPNCRKGEKVSTFCLLS